MVIVDFYTKWYIIIISRQFISEFDIFSAENTILKWISAQKQFIL